MRPGSRVAIFLAGLLFSALPARTQETACREDARRLCPQAQDGRQRIRCLDANNSVLSPGCRENLARMRARGEKFRQDCRDDAAQSCPGLEGRKLMSCLEANQARISRACSEHVARLRDERRVAKERIPAVCRPDAEKLCRPIPAGEGRIRRCLEENAAQLRKECRRNLAPADAPRTP